MPNVLVLGSGAREHALVAAISRSVDNPIICYPGNVGTCQFGEIPTLDVSIMDVKALAAYADSQKFDLTIVGPEAPMSAGIAEAFHARGLTILAPTSTAARLETSKVYAKRFMQRHGIPTADFEIFDNVEDAFRYVKTENRPLVIKADGLAGGKGVYVCEDLREQMRAIIALMIDKVHGNAGSQIVIEEKLEGPEASVFYLVAGSRATFVGCAGDYKRAYDGDKGPNTGGMGAYSPHPLFNPESNQGAQHRVRTWTQFMMRILEGLRDDKIDYRGFLYIGFMLTADGPKVLEFNVRLGDPEAQVILPRWTDGIYDALLCAAHGDHSGSIGLNDICTVGVTLASANYPKKEIINERIYGPLYPLEPKDPSSLFFHGATQATMRNKSPITTGGRIGTAVGLGINYGEARDRAYALAGDIRCQGMWYRKDIAEGLI